jgi:hypothetical protein
MQKERTKEYYEEYWVNNGPVHLLKRAQIAHINQLTNTRSNRIVPGKA